MSVRDGARVRSRARASIGIVVAAMLWSATGSADVVRGFKETWPGTSVQNWNSQAAVSNPGTGGRGGAGDGFLRMSRTIPNPLGAKSSKEPPDPASPFAGDYVAAHVTLIRLWVSDLATEQPIEVHLCIGNGVTLWQYNIGVQPSAGTWTEYVVDLTATAQWTRILGTDTFQGALQNADRLLVRHDVAPFHMAPDDITGDFGIDDLELTFDPVPAHVTTWGRLKALFR
jgi:hypothetical protein